jgi:hypothetical protein
MNEESNKQQEERKQHEPMPEFVAQILERLNRKLGKEEISIKPLYANNFHFEPSVWDLKILLGQLNQNKNDEESIDWHTALTIPWFQVKFVAYYLHLQVAWYELQNGKLPTPSRVMPPLPEVPSGERAADAKATEWYEIWKRIYAQTFGT